MIEEKELKNKINIVQDYFLGTDFTAVIYNSVTGGRYSEIYEPLTDEKYIKMFYTFFKSVPSYDKDGYRYIFNGKFKITRDYSNIDYISIRCTAQYDAHPLYTWQRWSADSTTFYRFNVYLIDTVNTYKQYNAYTKGTEIEENVNNTWYCRSYSVYAISPSDGDGILFYYAKPHVDCPDGGNARYNWQYVNATGSIGKYGGPFWAQGKASFCSSGVYNGGTQVYFYSNYNSTFISATDIQWVTKYEHNGNSSYATTDGNLYISYIGVCMHDIKNTFNQYISFTNTTIPENKIHTDGYWYELYKTEQKRGALEKTVESKDVNGYPSNGIAGSRWYVYKNSYIQYSKGSSTVSVNGSTMVNSTNTNAYPNNGYKDGYWYVKQ